MIDLPLMIYLGLLALTLLLVVRADFRRRARARVARQRRASDLRVAFDETAAADRAARKESP